MLSIRVFDCTRPASRHARSCAERRSLLPSKDPRIKFRSLFGIVAALSSLGLVESALAEKQLHASTAQVEPAVPVWTDTVELRWTYRGFGRIGFSKFFFEQQEPTRSSVATAGLEVIRPIRVSDRIYLAPGGHLAYGAAAAGRCSTQLVCSKDEQWCTCPGEIGSWHASGLAYGASVGLGFKTSPGKPYVVFWAPTLRLTSLAGSVGGNSECESLYDRSACEGTVNTNVIVSGSLEWDLVHSGFFGCTVGVGVGTALGDLAERDGIRPIYLMHFGYGVSVFDE